MTMTTLLLLLTATLMSLSKTLKMSLSTPPPRQLALAEKACSFLSASTDPFHAVKNSVAKLQAAGFESVANNMASIQPGGKYYYTVHHSTLVAFTVGKDYQPGQGGFHIIGGHTDSPNLAVKPRSKKPAKNGCLQLGVSTYGGGLFHTWLDRDCEWVLFVEFNWFH